MYKDSSTLLKRARAKYLSLNLAHKLRQHNPESPLQDSYFGSFLCCDVLRQKGEKFTSTYCKQRWCAVCNRVRTAKAISGYLPVINEMNDIHFVTLTKKTVSQEDLKSSIELMNKVWRKITDTARKKRPGFQGVRKAECTIRPGGLYHYHFHVIVSGRSNAEWLVNAWVDRLKGLADLNGQDLRKADERSLKELFKYFTKLTAGKKHSEDEERKLYEFTRMDVIFQAMRSRRVFQPFGGLRMISEEIEDDDEENDEYLDQIEVLWKWSSEDWISQVGEYLTGYRASEGFKGLFVESGEVTT